MLYKLHLLKYKNYYNRQVKRLKTIQEYDAYQTVDVINDVNFKPNDWIRTSHIFNIKENQIPNYIIVEKDDGTFTRWFVTESQRLRDGQYRLNLYRDVICDHLTEILNSDTFIEKGYIEDINSPLLFNKEDITTNQIKTKETLLYDKTTVPWLVAYLPKDFGLKEVTTNLTYTADYITTSYEGLADYYPYYAYIVDKHTTLINKESSGVVSYSDYLKILSEEGKIIRAGTKIYQIHIRSIRKGIYPNERIDFIIKLIEIGESQSGDGNIFTIPLTIKISDTIPYPKDCAYKIIAVPFSDDYFSKNVMLCAFQSLAQQSGNTIYDIQIVPYSPTQDNPMQAIDYKSDSYFQIGVATGTFNVNSGPALETYKNNIIIGETNPKTVYIQSATTNTLSFEIEVDYMLSHALASSIQVKTFSQVDSYRLCSPNYNGIFEFSPSMMGVRSEGSQFINIKKINVDITYKPYQPYIHVYPIFDGLYGTDFNDFRGLICGGDFSIEQTTSAWEQYKMQNKNYQQIFDRQIENMVTGNTINTVSNVASSIAGVVGAGAIFGPAGAIASGIGGIADLGLRSASMIETLDYTKDMHNFRLENIKAIPQSLSKTTSYNINSRYVPFIEAYTCTDIERLALGNKIKYNGMRIDIIGKLKDYIRNATDYDTYLKGKIIRSNISEDYNYVETVASEINKGFFVNVSDLDKE